ncbi:MAG: dienelactone hydrolase family protein [Rubricoccaceae bacterium]|nr:dienelactone hydrolase family protein [Rubricoccaceae bacterium]
MTTLHTSANTQYAGTPLEEAERAMIFLHGRGSSADDTLQLADHLRLTKTACVGLQATNHTWYPYSFLAPEAQNQPWLDSAIELVHHTLDDLNEQGFANADIYLLGFSQGACLALESVARRPTKYGGVFALSGGLIGLGVNQRTYEGDFGQTPVFMGCDAADPHIPKERFLDTADVLKTLNANVEAVLYDNLGHTINQDEIEWVNAILINGV